MYLYIVCKSTKEELWCSIACLPLMPKFASSVLADGLDFPFQEYTIFRTPSFGGDVKRRFPARPMSRTR